MPMLVRTAWPDGASKLQRYESIYHLPVEPSTTLICVSHVLHTCCPVAELMWTALLWQRHVIKAEAPWICAMPMPGHLSQLRLELGPSLAHAQRLTVHSDYTADI